MKKIAAILALISISASFSAFAEGSLPTGSWSCQKGDDDNTFVGMFYVRMNGTSKKVEVISAEPHENGMGIGGCMRVTYKWLDTGRTMSNAYCCPVGAN